MSPTAAKSFALAGNAASSPPALRASSAEDAFVRALDDLAAAPPEGHAVAQAEFLRRATLLVDANELEILHAHAHRFDPAGVFRGGPWEHVSRLRPALVGGGLRATGLTAIVELLSELRVLALAEGRYESEQWTAEEARAFLEEVLALNLALVFPSDDEEDRVNAGPYRQQSVLLFRSIAEHLGLDSLLDDVLEEIEQICAQRPILTSRVEQMLTLAARMPPRGKRGKRDKRLRSFLEAMQGASPLAKRHRDPTAYVQALSERRPFRLAREAKTSAAAMMATGLVSPSHALLVRHLAAERSGHLATALGLDPAGVVEFRRHEGLVHELVHAAVHPYNPSSVYGLGRTLDRGLLSRPLVLGGIERLKSMKLSPLLRDQLAARHPDHEADPLAVLLGGVFCVLGQPLGVGQGRNPTCQSARGISLWAQYAPGYLLSLTISAARDGFIEKSFEGKTLNSSLLLGGVATNIDLDLDPVSIAVVPHLDKLYDEMMRRAAGRGVDGHKWVNPAFYGRWVPSGFISAFSTRFAGTIENFADFVSTFFACFHLDATGGRSPMVPNPVGICVTTAHGDYLGLHAVSLTRVARGPQGDVRAYFFNPNNEGRQDWGMGVRPTVSGHGEIPGESSLPFEHFAARLYAFHYNPYERGDLETIPGDLLEQVQVAARDSWGKKFRWL